jgi:DNA-binding transcriptional regulator YiaG
MAICKRENKRDLQRKRIQRRYELIEMFRKHCAAGHFDKRVDEFTISPTDVVKVRMTMDLTNYDVARCLAMDSGVVSKFENGFDVAERQHMRIENWTREMKVLYNI